MKQFFHGIRRGGIALALCMALLLPVVSVSSVAAPAAEKISGEIDRTQSEILLPDGSKSGVKWTQINMSGHYGDDKLVNVAEFSLGNPHLSLEVINCGDQIVDVQTMDKAADAYNKSHPGQTVLAAVNGDLWMTKVHSSDEVTTKTLRATRGTLIIDGEIWASQQINNENLGATNGERGTPCGDMAAFGVTDQNQPLVGSPDIRVTATVNGKEIRIDGLNRLPALNSLILYNHRINSSNYSLNDAYEVELEADGDTAFRAGGTLKAHVKAIYPAKSENRPAIGEKTFVLTARGPAISRIQHDLKVGDEVTFNTTLTDRRGHTELWQHVEDAIGGHLEAMIDGRPAVINGDPSEYPAALIGYKDNGSVMLVSVTSNQDKKYKGLRFNQAYDFCREMGYNSVFYLDGGGSTTFVTLEEGSYTVRNKCSDGQPRTVINGVGVVWNEEKVVDKQGPLNYIKIPVDMSAIPATYLDGALLKECVSAPNTVTLNYDEAEKAFVMTTTQMTNDPYATLDLTQLKRLSADDNPYIVFKVKSNNPKNASFSLFYAAGNDAGAAGDRVTTVPMPASTDWQYITVDMSKISRWTGNINSLRLDIFDGAYTPEGMSVYFGAVVFCHTAEEAEKVKTGWAPEGSVTDYLAYLESLRPVETEPETTTAEETTAPAETETEPETTTVEETTTAAPETTLAPETTAAPETTTGPATTEAETTGKSGGCKSSLALAAPMLLIPAAAVLWTSRKKKD